MGDRLATFVDPETNRTFCTNDYAVHEIPERQKNAWEWLGIEPPSKPSRYGRMKDLPALRPDDHGTILYIDKFSLDVAPNKMPAPFEAGLTFQGVSLKHMKVVDTSNDKMFKTVDGEFEYEGQAPPGLRTADVMPSPTTDTEVGGEPNTTPTVVVPPPTEAQADPDRAKLDAKTKEVIKLYGTPLLYNGRTFSKEFLDENGESSVHEGTVMSRESNGDHYEWKIHYYGDGHNETFNAEDMEWYVIDNKVKPRKVDPASQTPGYW